MRRVPTTSAGDPRAVAARPAERPAAKCSRLHLERKRLPQQVLDRVV